MILIFYLSNQNGIISGSNSSSTVYNILEFIYNLFNINTYNINDVFNIIHPITREVMHSIEYLILGILVINALNKTKHLNTTFISLMICFIYSVTDEIHQLFVIGRTFEYLDLGMDLIGYVIGIYLYNLINRKIYKK